MRTDRIASHDRAGIWGRWRVEDSGPGTSARRPALSVWPSGPPKDPRGDRTLNQAEGRGLGSNRPSSWHFPGDEVAIESYVVLENDPALIPPLLAQLHETANRLGLFDAGTADRVAVALTEALLNGIQHGNLELDSRLRQDDEATYERMAEFRRRRPPYRDRQLHVRARLSLAEAIYVIRDEGPGFDLATLPDPTDPAHLERTTGRGLLLIRAYMDEVAFNGAGNQITLLKRPCTNPPNARGLCNELIERFRPRSSLWTLPMILSSSVGAHGLGWVLLKRIASTAA